MKGDREFARLFKRYGAPAQIDGTWTFAVLEPLDPTKKNNPPQAAVFVPAGVPLVAGSGVRVCGCSYRAARCEPVLLRGKTLFQRAVLQPDPGGLLRLEEEA